MIKRVFVIICCLLLVFTSLLSRSSTPSHAEAADTWWDDGWPYRIGVWVTNAQRAPAYRVTLLMPIDIVG